MNTASKTQKATITVKSSNRSYAREILALSHAKHGTGVAEFKHFGGSTFEIDATPYALKVLATCLADVA